MSLFAFFDVDETLIDAKTLLSTFQAHLQELYGNQEGLERYTMLMATLSSQARDRTEANLKFYRMFAGFSSQELALTCQRWFNEVGQFRLKQPVIERLRQHQDEGAHIVFVSGSYRQCLIPLARMLNVTSLLCTELRQNGDQLDGSMIGVPTIGDGKRQRVEQFLLQQSSFPNSSIAYGDHESDMPMLRLADRMVIVDNQELFKVVNSKGVSVEHIATQLTTCS